MKIKFFTMELHDVAELKTAYKDLIKKYHPDVEGGSNEDMKIINAEYEYLFNNVHELQKSKMTEDELKTDFHSLDDNFREQLLKIIFLKNINIDIVKSWIWVSGQTFEHAQVFRDSNFMWSKTKKAWYWYNNINPNRRFRHAYCKNLDAVKNMHGYRNVQLEEQKQLATI